MQEELCKKFKFNDEQSDEKEDKKQVASPEENPEEELGNEGESAVQDETKEHEESRNHSIFSYDI